MDTTTSLESASKQGWGLPHDRATQRAACQALVALKREFMEAEAPLNEDQSKGLHQQVGLVHEPIDL